MCVFVCACVSAVGRQADQGSWILLAVSGMMMMMMSTIQPPVSRLCSSCLCCYAIAAIACRFCKTLWAVVLPGTVFKPRACQYLSDSRQPHA